MLDKHILDIYDILAIIGNNFSKKQCIPLPFPLNKK